MEDTIETSETTADTDGVDELAKWKELARKHEARAKQNAEAAQRLEQLEEQQKSEQQRAAERAEAAEKERDQARAELLRERVARRHQLPDDLAARLQGADEEELDADAKKLSELIAPKTPETVDDRPKPRLSDDSPSAAEPKTGAQLAEEVVRKRRGF